MVGVYDSAKILIWKQITTEDEGKRIGSKVYMTLQRYLFESKSQPLSLLV